ncbi:MAG: malonate decarboxylase subunit alpha, partial [Deltaproteobacteria bacterium]|nr:malonate decarboxylase subunit alpha [Deltaproteobacteria bacterium]
MMNSIRDNCNPGKVIEPRDAKKLLLATIRSGDRVVMEGNNQKQATFLSKILADLSPSDVNDL